MDRALDLIAYDCGCFDTICYYKNFLKEKGFALYGAGKYGRFALKELNGHDLTPLFFIDDGVHFKDAKIENIPVVSLKESLSGHNDFFIIISNYYVEQCVKRLDEYGVNHDRVLFINGLFINRAEINALCENRENLATVYGFLGDLKSRLIFNELIECRKTKCMDLFLHLNIEQQYFPKVLSFSDNEVFVDCGAFDGDTIEQFLNATSGRYKKIYAFEPNNDTYKLLKSKYTDSDIVTFNSGVYSKDCHVDFISSRNTSSISETSGGGYSPNQRRCA